MAGDAKKLQPITVKRVKRGRHAPHGGAWKIAYADFVTAMMAFFLLMWLLGSTTEGDKKGIADFFQSPLRVALLGGGSGAGDASSLVKGGGTDLTRSEGQVKQADVRVPRSHFDLHKLREERRRAEAVQLRALQHKLDDTLAGDPRLAPWRSQIRIDLTRDGLRIQIVDEQNRPMFDSGSAVIRPPMREILRAVGQVLAAAPNRLTLEGHTDAQPYAPRNRRISIVVMNRDAEERFFGTQGDDEPDAGAERVAAPVGPGR